MKLLQEFLDNNREMNKWIDENGYNTYYRKSFKTNIPGANRLVEPVLDLANINAHEDKRGKQGFAAHIEEVIRVVQESLLTVIHVENVLNKDFEKYLIREHGFKALPRTKGLMGLGADVCLYKRI